MSHYETNLNKNDANYVPLTPLTFLKGLMRFIPIMKQLFMKIGNILGVKFINEL